MLNLLLSTEGTGGIDLGEILQGLMSASGLNEITWQAGVMIVVACLLLYLAIVKGFEPLLLLPIAFGTLLINIPGSHDVLFAPPSVDISHAVGGVLTVDHFANGGGLLWWLYKGVDLVIYPPLIFLGIGAMTDFGPMIANPKSMILGAAAQIGIFVTFIGALLIGGLGIEGLNFDRLEAAAIAIIGGADGPTAIYLSSKLAPHMVPTIAIAAYSYMALVPVIQPPIMRALTTKEERAIKMQALRQVSKLEKVAFPLIVTVVVGIVLPDALPLLGMLMLGNLMKESGVVERISKTAQNELINIITILLGISVGCKTYYADFLTLDTLGVLFLGLAAFCVGTASGVLLAKLMNKLSGGTINPLIGSAGVSAVPMAARISNKVGLETDKTNYLLMHAMGPNVAGVIGSAIAAGVLLSMKDIFAAVIGG